MRRITDAHFNELIEELEKFFTLSDEFKEKLKSFLYEEDFNKGKRILNAGAKQHVVWFMLKETGGLAREIRFDEKTVWFWLAHSFLYAVPGFFNQEPSESTFEILEDCTLVFISYEDWARLKDAFEETNILTEKIRGEYQRKKLELIDDIMHLNTDERYLKHEEELQILFTKAKLIYIAEYLGMSADTLSKLRKKYLRFGT
jgi:CRP-like cAMP-binding protein